MRKFVNSIIVLVSIVLNLVLVYYYVRHDDIIGSKLAIKEILGLGVEDNEWVLKIVDDIQSSKHASNSELFDAVRNYIHQNSRHKEGTHYHQTRSFNTDSVLKDIYKLKHRTSDNVPDMSCSPRAWAMRRILKAMSFETRILMFYQVRNEKLFSHTVIEVKNKENDKWELHDPDVNIFFKDTVRGERVSFMAMKDMATSIYTPCRNDTCDWSLAYYSLKDKRQFGAVQIHYLKEHFKDQQVFIDTKYFTAEELMVLQSNFVGQKNVLFY
jgi:hypothetical protein